MNRQEILDCLENLSHAQGFYGRLLRDLQENPELLARLEAQKFVDTIDLILFLEHG